MRKYNFCVVFFSLRTCYNAAVGNAHQGAHEIAVEPQKGTKKLAAKYGASLLYVRYRYDESRGIRLTSVELVEEEAPWQPRKRRRNDELVAVAVGFAEKELRQSLKGAGGKWDPEQKVWQVPYGAIRGTELAKRIVREGSARKPGE